MHLSPSRFVSDNSNDGRGGSHSRDERNKKMQSDDSLLNIKVIGQSESQVASMNEKFEGEKIVLERFKDMKEKIKN